MGPIGLDVSISHIRAVPSSQPVTTDRPSLLNVTAYQNGPRCRIGLDIGDPVSASQTMTVLSKLPVATRRPSGLKATVITEPWWPSNFCFTLQSSVPITRVSLSPAPTAIREPSGLKASALMGVFEIASTVRRGRPAWASHSFTTPSNPPLTAVFPSGLMATVQAAPVCLKLSPNGIPVAKSQN